MLIGSGLQALATSGKFKPVALGQIRTAGNTWRRAPDFEGQIPGNRTEDFCKDRLADGSANLV
jgi:hypothetical protein